MKPDPYQPLQQAFTVNAYVNRGLTFTKGRGVYLYDLNQVKYLDLMSNYGVNIFGHYHPYLTTNLTKQLKNLTTLHQSFNNNVRAQAAKMLVSRCGNSLKKVYFSNSGAEAVEAALKFAVLSSGKKKFIVAKHAYHGKTLGALSATQDKRYRQAFTPLLWHFKKIDFADTKALEKIISSEYAAVILEPIQGESGINIPANDYLKKISRLCRQNGVALILDEIQTGCGRTGTFLASQSAGIDYDLVCLGKGLAGGIPIGATLVSAQIAAKIPKHIHTSTFGGNPLACAGVLATLKLLDQPTLNHIQKIGLYFKNELKKQNYPHVKEIRGQGLMIGLEVNCDRDKLLKKLQEQHILAIPAGNSVIRFLPPFIIQKKHLDQTIKILSVIFNSI